jgi:hypothetical protein
MLPPPGLPVGGGPGGGRRAGGGGWVESAPARSRAGEQEPGFGGIRLPLERVVMDVDTGDCHGPHCCSFRQAWISNSFYIVLIMN